MNQDLGYAKENLILEISDDFQVDDNALFVSPEIVFRDIGESLFAEVQEQKDKDDAKKERRKNRFRRVKNLVGRLKGFFRKAEKEAE